MTEQNQPDAPRANTTMKPSAKPTDESERGRIRRIGAILIGAWRSQIRRLVALLRAGWRRLPLLVQRAIFGATVMLLSFILLIPARIAYTAIWSDASGGFIVAWFLATFLFIHFKKPKRKRAPTR